MFKWTGIPTPKAPVHELADFAELVCWRDGSASVTSLSHSLDRADENDYSDGVPEDEETPNDVGEAFSEIETRAKACRSGYPFVVEHDGNAIHIAQDANDSKSIIYQYLLLATRLNMRDNRIHAGIDGAHLFEELSAEISQEYFGSRAKSTVFGTASGSADFPGKVNDLCNKSGEGGGFMDHTGKSLRQKDGKLDVVAWKSFADGRAGKLIAFGQCKTGTNWRDDVAKLQPDVFCGKWFRTRPASMLIRMFFVSEAIHTNDWMDNAIDAGLLFDRCRIIDFSDNVSGQLLAKIAKWTMAAAQATELPIDGIAKILKCRGQEMVAQLRTYTINRGMMDSWLKVFDEEIRPIHDKIGMPVSNTWVNADRNEFIWVRNFNSVGEIAEKEAAYFASDERQALGDKPTSHIAKIEVKVIEGVLQPAAVA